MSQQHPWRGETSTVYWRRHGILVEWEYGIPQDAYTAGYAGVDGIEQGYHIPHYSDHDGPHLWSDRKIERLMGHTIPKGHTDGRKI